ncbi:MAG TPA: hypothetical protein VJA21_00330 [Verrucomicrobiae bacterium]
MTRLMCSKNRTEVESVKKELFRAGIRSEIRSNPLADALRVTRLELWVEDERDLFSASKLYAEMQARASVSTTGRAGASRNEDPKVFFEVPAPDDQPDHRQRRHPDGSHSRNGGGDQGGELEQASSLLEKEIDNLLERESKLAEMCASLRSQNRELNEALALARSEAAREKESRVAADKEQAAEVLGLRSNLEHEKAEHARAAEQLERERLEARQQLKSRDEALTEARNKLETKLQQVEAQQTAVVELRKELVARELESKEHEKLLAKAHAEGAAEREARIAAEERAQQTAAAQKALEKQLAAQKDLQHQVEACAASLNSLRSRLQAKRAVKPPPESE